MLRLPRMFPLLILLLCCALLAGCLNLSAPEPAPPVSAKPAPMVNLGPTDTYTTPWATITLPKGWRQVPEDMIPKSFKRDMGGTLAAMFAPDRGERLVMPMIIVVNASPPELSAEQFRTMSEADILKRFQSKFGNDAKILYMEKKDEPQELFFPATTKQAIVTTRLFFHTGGIVTVAGYTLQKNPGSTALVEQAIRTATLRGVIPR